jgi:predicted transport protein|tara:strand:+ start:73 stop:1032 length:960 start_codon:yes stop_codon:yes gene_type:complete
MILYDNKKGVLKDVDIKPFKKEIEIQRLVEENCETIFQLDFIITELTVGNYRVDSLCFDHENNSFVIIEYKKGNSYSVIDQGYTYLQLLLNNKSDFVLVLSHHLNKVLKIENINWSGSKILFVSQSYNSYQKDSVNFKNLPFELWEIKRYSNESVLFNKHTSSSKESIDSLSNISSKSLVSNVSKEVRVVDEDVHIGKCDEDLKILWDDLKSRMDDLEGVDLIVKNNYINWVYLGKNICYFIFRKSSIVLELGRGNVNPDGSKSKNYFNIDDPKKISKESSWTWKSGTKGTIYKIPIKKNSDIDYLMFLIKQKYKNQNL